MRRLGWSALLIGLTGLSLMLSTLLQSTTAHRYTDLKSMGFGLPFPWLRQDLTGVDQRLPFRPHPRLPQEFPTTISWASLAVDFLACALLLVLAHALYRRIMFSRATGPIRA